MTDKECNCQIDAHDYDCPIHNTMLPPSRAPVEAQQTLTACDEELEFHYFDQDARVCQCRKRIHLDDIAGYLKDGETSAECIRRNRDDVLAVLSLLQKEKSESEALRAALAASHQRAEKLVRERDLAVAHDRQPYPTAYAYNSICRAHDEWKHRAEKAEAQLAARPSEREAPTHGSEVLCPDCAVVFCPHGERLHFHHDGCPLCDANEPSEQCGRCGTSLQGQGRQETAEETLCLNCAIADAAKNGA